jgi:hypothetical protein
MLSVMTTLACSAIALLVWLAVRDRADNDYAMLWARLLHFSAIITACLSLVLLPVVYKVRRDAPPTSLVIVSVVAAVLPIVAAFV